MDSFEVEMKNGFLDEAKELLTNAEQCFLSLEKAKDDPSIIEEIFRLAHNLKGSAGAVGFTDLGEFTHKLESLLLKIKNKEIEVSRSIVSLLLECNDFLIHVIDGLKQDLSFSQKNPELQERIENHLSGQISVPSEPTTEPTPALPNETNETDEPHFVIPKAAVKMTHPDENIRVSLGKIDDLLNNVGELVILQTVMAQQKINIPVPFIKKTVDQMTKIIKEIQSTSMGLRMLPLKHTFQKMQRIVRDTSATLGKKVNLNLNGEETELDKTVLEQLGDPLVHLIRNAVDHGLESPEERELAGKNEVGNIHLSAFHRGGQIIIEIKDDGRGLDPAKLIKKAQDKGLISADQVLSDDQAYQLIFAPGFSTKEQVTDVSGRGVGMDVVKTNIQSLQGDIELETVQGSGTCIRIVLPLTLAIVDGMVVSLGEERFVVPIAQIIESLRPQKQDISTVNEISEVLNLRGETLPIYRLENLLKKKSPVKKSAWEGILLIVRDNNQRGFSIFVDDIICQQQVVIKKLGGEIGNTAGFSGAAILGDGRVSFILDLFELTLSSRSQKQISKKQPAQEAA